MINRYRKFLEIVDTRLNSIFKKQAPFIKCKEGCAYCCKEGEFPLSELEYINLMLFYTTLSSEKKGIINYQIQNLLNQKRQKLYTCPFLVDNSCSVYEARPLICRTFGLISYKDDGKPKMPFCIDFGLNYANVCDEEKNLLVRFADDGTEPLAYNIDRRTLRGKDNEEMFDIYFGEDKALAEWLREDNSFIKYP